MPHHFSPPHDPGSVAIGCPLPSRISDLPGLPFLKSTLFTSMSLTPTVSAPWVPSGRVSQRPSACSQALTSTAQEAPLYPPQPRLQAGRELGCLLGLSDDQPLVRTEGESACLGP